MATPLLPTNYVTEYGDMWDSISLYFYNTEYLSDKLQYVNPEYATVWVFDSGITLYIPFISVKRNIQTPPWVSIWQG